MVRVSTFGPTVKHMTENGSKHARTASALGLDYKKTATSANGKTTKYGDMVFISGLMETSMKESGLLRSRMGPE